MAKTVLMVEDCDLLRRSMSRILQRKGFTVEAVATVPEGEARLKESTPDILLLDREVEGRDGWSLRSQASPNTRVVLMTGNSPPDAPRHFEKGDSLDTLLRMMEEEIDD